VITGGGGSSRTRYDFEITSDDFARMTSALAAGFFPVAVERSATGGVASARFAVGSDKTFHSGSGEKRSLANLSIIVHSRLCALATLREIPPRKTVSIAIP
jgi:hypothetical protein